MTQIDTSTETVEALKSDIMLLKMNGEHWVTAQDYLALLAERDAAILRAEKAKTREMALREALRDARGSLCAIRDGSKQIWSKIVAGAAEKRSSAALKAWEQANDQA